MRSLLLAALLAVAPGPAQQKIPPAPPVPPSPPQAAPSKAPKAPPTQDATVPVLQRLHEFDQMVIAVAQLARERSKTDDVRDYADRLIRDHRQADEDLAKQAARLHVQLQGTPEETAALAERVKGLTGLVGAFQGPDFDRVFVLTMGMAHENVVRLLQQAQPAVQDRDVRALLRRRQAIDQQDLDLAVHLSKRLPGTPRAVGLR
jgi:putative membrane protein